MGNSMFNPIIVPAGIERPSELEGLLTEIKPLTRSKKSFWNKYPLLPAIAVMALMVAALVAEDKYLSTVFGMIFVGVFGYSWGAIQKHLYDKRARLISHVCFIPIILVIARIVWNWTS